MPSSRDRARYDPDTMAQIAPHREQCLEWETMRCSHPSTPHGRCSLATLARCPLLAMETRTPERSRPPRQRTAQSPVPVGLPRRQQSSTHRNSLCLPCEMPDFKKPAMPSLPHVSNMEKTAG